MKFSELAIVDCHHHLWDLQQNYYPWLTDKITKRVCGNYAAIRKNYLIENFLADIGDLNVVKTVHVQAEHDFSDPVRETAWLDEVSRRPSSRGIPQAIVAWADLAAPNLEETLDAHCRYAGVRGIRQMCHEAYIDPLSNQHKSTPLSDPSWRAGIKKLKNHNLSFDLQFYYQQVEDAFSIAAENPQQSFVIVHAGQPAERSDAGLAAWKAALKRMAKLDNCTIKLSGLGMFDRNWQTESLRPIILTVIEIFGVHRCMFGSNFPVDGMMSSYQGLWQAYFDVVRDFTDSEIQQLFAGTAERVYRL